MASRRTKSIGTKVTPEEYARIQTLAGEQPVSEWVRVALLKAAADTPAVDSIILAELFALRAILLNLAAYASSSAPALVRGPYEGAVRFPFEGPNPGLDFSGDGLLCERR